ncbi:MAG: DUF3019 domain-containing protein [Colwellia sp.]|nr:DUF3019 domain-containing protein [Colwellia sp.]
MNFLTQLIVNKSRIWSKQSAPLKSAFNFVSTKVFGVTLLLMLSFQLPAAPFNVEPKLTIVPEQCVALLQGQACYVTVELNWQTPVAGNYCLYSSLNTHPIQCWRDKKMGRLKQEFVSKNNIEFFLQKLSTKENIANIEIKMAWVHKKKGRPRTSWRMF